MPITALYAALLVPLYVFLTVRIIRIRQAERISIGDAGNPVLLRQMRVHGNFSEYVPYALLLIALAESLHVAPLLLHVLGIVLVASRLAHAIGVSPPREDLRLRTIGVVGTFAVLAVAALVCLVGALRTMF